MKKTLFANAYELSPIYDRHASFYGKAIVTEEGDAKALYSYGVLVASYEDGKLTIYTDDPNYWSATSRRHIAEFAGQQLGCALKPSEAKKMARIINE